MSAETTPPIRLSDQTKIRLPLAMLIALVGIAATAAVVWSGDHKAVQEIPMIELRVRKLEDGAAAIAVMQRDIEWIRKRLEREDRRNNP
jgi:hypothetical protein